MELNHLTAEKSYQNLPTNRLHYIDKSVAWFLQVLGLTDKDWLIDCVQIIQRIKDSKCIAFDYGFFDLPVECDAVSVYVNAHQVYLMQINRNKINYPFTNSRDRRLNFTLAHELGHIVLGHLRVPRSLKPDLEICLEEQEADEFAGRLLMPANIVYSCNFYSLAKVAAYLNVSKSALWTRLNNMERLDLLDKRKVPTCDRCGNTIFSPYSEFCGICGQDLDGNLNGIRRILYPDSIPMDRFKRVQQCPRCGAGGNFASGDQCNRCGTYIFNYCSGFFSGDCSYAAKGNHLYCEICGKPTYFLQKGFWGRNPEAINEMINLEV